MEAWDLEISEKDRPKKESAKKDLSISEEGKEKILQRWNDKTKTPPSIAELVVIAFPEIKEVDKRSKEAILVKEFIVKNGLKETKEEKIIELNEDQKEYIKNNAKSMKPMEMARVVFISSKITPNSMEVRLVNDFIKTLPPEDVQNEFVTYEYRPPIRIDACVARIKKYIPDCENWDGKKLSIKQRKQTESLIRYLSTYRFKHQIDTYDSQKDKDLFESTFIKYCYDKEDLTQENIDQYILLCSEVIQLYHIELNIINLENEQRRIMDEEGKMSMALVEAIKVAGTERSDCVKRQQLLYKSLTQERSDRVSKEMQDKQSIISLVNAWKNQESRMQMIKLAKEKKDELRKELHEIDNLEEMKMRILGLSIDEIVDG